MMGFLLFFIYPYFTSVASRFILEEVHGSSKKTSSIENLVKLWNEWDLRCLVLLSMLIQIILVLFGSRRKSTASKVIRILVWGTYVSADSVATSCLSILAKYQDVGDSLLQKQHQLQVLWAPFLLLHLGGPGTITAYSLEDNNLWTRHLLNLVLQVGVASYVIFKSWSENINNNNSVSILVYIAIPVFVAGAIKYGERTWVLKSASAEGLPGSPGDLQPIDPNATYLEKASYFLDKLRSLFANELYFEDGSTRVGDSAEAILRVKSPLEAFEMVEVELGFIYDLLYTKASLVYSRWGIVLRFICLASSIFSLIAFSVYVKDNWSNDLKIDISITYLLIIGAVVLEVCAVTLLIFSDWTLLWLAKQQMPLAATLRRIISSFRQVLFHEKRWSQCMRTHNLIGFYITSCKSCSAKIARIENKLYDGQTDSAILILWRQMNADVRELTDNLKDMIFKQLKEKHTRYSTQGFGDDVLKQLLAERGDHALQKNNCLEEFQWSTSGADFDRSLFTWHIATDLCYYLDDRDKFHDVHSYADMSKSLSDYMMYLQILHPKMMPRGNTKDRYRVSLLNVAVFAHNNEQVSSCIKDDQFHKELLSSVSESMSDETSHYNVHNIVSVLEDGVRLAKLLQSFDTEDGVGQEKKWNMVCEVWVEMLAYAANQCGWQEHAQQLRRGGELLTHVAVLMANLRLSEQIRIYVG